MRCRGPLHGRGAGACPRQAGKQAAPAGGSGGAGLGALHARLVRRGAARPCPQAQQWHRGRRTGHTARASRIMSPSTSLLWAKRSTRPRTRRSSLTERSARARRTPGPFAGPRSNRQAPPLPMARAEPRRRLRGSARRGRPFRGGRPAGRQPQALVARGRPRPRPSLPGAPAASATVCGPPCVMWRTTNVSKPGARGAAQGHACRDAARRPPAPAASGTPPPMSSRPRQMSRWHFDTNNSP